MDFNNISMDDIYTGDINELLADSTTKLNHFCAGLGIVNGVGEVIEPKVQPYKTNAILIKVADCGYVDIDDIKNFLSCISINRKLSKDGHGFTLGGIVM